MRLPCRMGILLLPKSEDCGMIYLYKFFLSEVTRLMKTLKTVFAVLAAAVSFFTTVLCMRDVLAARDDLQKESR